MPSAILNEIKNAVIGCIDIALFMPRGVERFNDGWAPLLRSLIIPLALMPLTYVNLSYMQEAVPELADLSYTTVALLFAAKGLCTLAVTLGIMIIFAKTYDKMDYLLRTITISNWMSVFLTILYLPILVTVITTDHSWLDMYQFDILHAVYGYILIAFVLTHAMKIPWEMAGFLAIVGIAIQHTSLDVVLWAAQALST